MRSAPRWRVIDVDHYKRIVCRVSCADVDANAAQVRPRMAWVNDRYVKNEPLYHLQGAAFEAIAPTSVELT